jgi:hypothetical protein
VAAGDLEEFWAVSAGANAEFRPSKVVYFDGGENSRYHVAGLQQSKVLCPAPTDLGKAVPVKFHLMT